jgi:hypothetical protein
MFKTLVSGVVKKIAFDFGQYQENKNIFCRIEAKPVIIDTGRETQAYDTRPEMFISEIPVEDISLSQRNGMRAGAVCFKNIISKVMHGLKSIRYLSDDNVRCHAFSARGMRQKDGKIRKINCEKIF